jgi:hypothetical protein
VLTPHFVKCKILPIHHTIATCRFSVTFPNRSNYLVPSNKRKLKLALNAAADGDIPLLYDKFGLRHLTGLKAASPQRKALIGRWSDEQIETFPLVEDSSPQYWGRTRFQRAKSVLSGRFDQMWEAAKNLPPS